MNYSIKKTNIIRLFRYVQKQKENVKKEKVNGNVPREKN